MKTPRLINYHNSNVLLKMLVIGLLAWSCEDDVKVEPLTECSSGNVQKPFSDEPSFNLNIFFSGSKPSMCGFVEFRQQTDNAQFIHLDTWVHGLEPSTNYLLQRAVDTTLDGDCSSTDWLTLGKGMTPQSITTDGSGDAYVELYRSVAAIAVGTTFDIHFQIIKESDSSVILTSDCYEYTVR